MKKLALVLILFFVLVTTAAIAQGKIDVDPNTGPPPVAAREAKDTRLAQKITYEARRKPVAAVLADLKEMTGIVFRAGSHEKDWQVRELKINIFAKDIALSELMTSISHATRLSWERGGKEEQWTYRLYMDQKTLRMLKL